MSRGRVLIVDDEPTSRLTVRDFLQMRGFEVLEAPNCAVARELQVAERPEAAVVDYALPDGNAFDLLKVFRESDPGLAVVILTGYGTIDLAVRAIRQGADHFMTKPVALDTLATLVERLIEARRDRRHMRAKLTGSRVIDPFVGTSRVIRELAEEARRVLASESPVLIRGETGSGKGTLAQWIHAHGSRASEPFVDLNCAGLSRELLESELFGHEKGAFTGAVAAKPGLFEAADRGTMFLDEIGDLHLDVQAKLLKALENKRFRRLGEVRERTVDVRLVAATHVDLAARVREGSFRTDLYFRIHALPLKVPALRERPEDIQVLAGQILATLASELRRPGIVLDPAALAHLERYAWPGNIRELRNVLERAVLYSADARIGVESLRFDEGASPLANAPSQDLELTLAELERLHITRVLAAEGGRVERAAARLGIPRSTLYQKIKVMGIDPRGPS